MNFLSPAFLLGLPLLAVPLVIHLLSRRQQKKISWGAMRFLMQAATRKRRLWRLTDILLMMLRTAAFLFFIAALARPLLPVTWLGGSVPRDVILVLDQSMSMSRNLGGRSAFDVQMEKADAVLSQLSSADNIRVLLARESPEWLTPDPAPATAAAVRKIRAQLAELKPTLAAANLPAAIREAADLEAPKEKSARVIVVLTDGQRFAWRADEKALLSSVQARVRDSEIPTLVSVQMAGDPQPAANLSVNKVDVARPFGAIDQALTFTATVQNYSDAASSATLLTWRVGEQPAGVVTVPELVAGASTSVTLSHQFPSAGTFDVSCQMEAADDLKADNSAHRLVEIFDRLPVLLVEDSKDAESLEADAPFVLAALGARGKQAGSEWRSVFEPTAIPASALGTTELSRFHAVILANVATLAAADVQKLEHFAEAGGGIWISAGSRTDERFFNEQLYRGGAGIAPMKVGAAVGDPNDREKFFAVRASSESHPATALLADFQRLDLDRARIYRRHPFDPLSGKDVSILLQAGGGEPVVVERKFGKGRVLVQGIPLGVSWSTLPLCQAYVAMLHEWLWYLSEANLPRRNLSVGETFVSLSTNKTAQAELLCPDGRKLELTGETADGVVQYRHAAALPGDYVLHQASGGIATKFHVHRDPQESDLKPLTTQDREQLAAAKEFRFDGALEGSVGKVEMPKHPLEGWLLVGLAAVILGELLLAGWATHKRNLRVKPVIMTP